jgi:uncharacterized protein (TIGR01777 family)
VLPGGSGHVGTILSHHFHDQGHKVVVLSRQVHTEPWRVVKWDASSLGDWTVELRDADVVINLTGRSVNCRYNQKNREEIMSSRVVPTRLIGEAIASLSTPPPLWMNMSTATIYRHSFDRDMDEATGELGGNEPGAANTWHFSIDVATSWEHAFFTAPTPMTRRVALRSAMVMSSLRDGVFDLLLRLVRFGAGGTVGSGKQYVSWVHDQDFVRAIEHLVQREDIDGTVNIASPNPLPNRDFMSELRRTWGIGFGIPAPNAILELAAVIMRTETELLLKSRRVIPGRLIESDFQFEFPAWRKAADNLVSRWRNGS